MKNTVVVFNAGIGAMALAFQNAGYRIVKAYEKEEKSAAVYRKNISGDLSVCKISFIDRDAVPESDVWAVDLTRVGTVEDIHKDRSFEGIEEIRGMMEIIRGKFPTVLLIAMKRKLFQLDIVRENLEELERLGYHLIWKNIQSAEITGIPVAEEFMYIIASRIQVSSENGLMPQKNEKARFFFHDFAERRPEERWYYKVGKDKIDSAYSENSLLCWRNGVYRECDHISWNLIKMPLVCVNGVYHKITHREVARLKGFPDTYEFSVSNKAWMYRKLAYAPNVAVTKIIADNIQRYIFDQLKETISKPDSSEQFKWLFGRYLQKQGGKVRYVEDEHGDGKVDYVYEFAGKTWPIEVKLYSNAKNARLNRLLAYSRFWSKEQKTEERKSEDNFSERKICAVANLVSDEEKKSYENAGYGYIWDIRNILWMFETYPELKNALVALLNYSTEKIELEKPDHFIFPEESIDEKLKRNEYREIPQQESSVSEGYIQQLENLPPGTAHFREYENLCVSILKYTLGEYLSLWEQQSVTEHGLYRFDMCCKIKNGVTQDFFDTISRYFQTKYIVFEFKNNGSEITQQEIYTTEKYLYEKALRKVAIIVSRKGANENALAAARGSLRESNKLIICLSDDDLVKMLKRKEEGEKTTGEYLENILDQMMIRLEK